VWVRGGNFPFAQLRHTWITERVVTLRRDKGANVTSTYCVLYEAGVGLHMLGGTRPWRRRRVHPAGFLRRGACRPIRLCPMHVDELHTLSNCTANSHNPMVHRTDNESRFHLDPMGRASSEGRWRLSAARANQPCARGWFGLSSGGGGLRRRRQFLLHQRGRIPDCNEALLDNLGQSAGHDD
jgi:hypothetical protein